MMTLTAMQKYKTYKWSGNPFFGDIPSCWDIYPLFKIAKIKSIINKQDEELLSVYLDRGVIKFSDVDEKRTNVTSLDLSKYQFVEKGDFVLNNQQAWRGSVGVSNHIGIVSPAYLVLSLSKEINPKYANYLFRDGSMVSQYLICSKGVGTIQRNLYWPHLRRTIVALPSYIEQTAIANFLDTKTNQIDEAIAIKEQQIALLNERKQILIQQAVTQGLDPTVPMKDSGVEWIGKIPEHWIVKRAKYLFNEIDERSVNGDEELLSVSHITGVTPRSEKNVNMFMAEDYSGSKTCEKNDLVFNIMWAWMGALGVSDRRGIVSPSYGVFRAKAESTFNPIFLEYLLKSTNYIEHYNKVSTGLHSSRLRFYGHMFFDMEMGFPSFEEQNYIIEHVQKESDVIDKALSLQEQQIEALKEYKTTLINSAVTGKIKVV
ncbi:MULTISPECIES: restriction endonuclease subunit S [Aeromonas]|jgi:type I restriction enzyme S subunit|uniref:restriction endonuclease subunit S n=1 Tax=Aeromonas TaxID=642 RepID=UPI001959091F|nr:MULTISPECIES: restriction endonuclease subunit S [Aeromonas]MCJ7928969.1 restriction endonuclease subunit S [Aeromonas sp. LsrichE-8G]MCR3985520.1 restriction endonuclease subunit S [Aeromonas caviae]MCX4050846.1 restriction endonuclease subunit S [Aeromonas caviae]MCX4110307.1 restriction endonuclease subunit S [Aeromonas caviae]MDX7645603.1 restriction endonuclease subunit S [Aeromonas caviae]